MMYEKLLGLASALALAAFVLTTGGAPAWADDVDIFASFDSSGPGATQEFEHIDGGEFKGWANLTLTNITLGPWGWFDLHIIIFDCGYGSVENVDFVVDSPYAPWSSQSGLAWEVNNDGTEATIDFTFTEPVMPSETADFHIWTDNTFDHVPRFGLKIYPTIIPEPSTALLLACGLVGLAIRERRRRV